MTKQHEIPEDFKGMYDLIIAKIVRNFGIPYDYVSWKKEANVVQYAAAMVGTGKELEVEFETSVVYGRMGEIIHFAKTKKRWGRMLRFRGLDKDENDFLAKVCDNRLVYVLKDNNVIKQRMITRNEYKLMVGPGLVNRALKENLSKGNSSFVDQLTVDEGLALGRLGLSPRDFWRDCRNGNITRVRRLALPNKRRKPDKRYYLEDVDRPKDKGGESKAMSIAKRILERV